VNQSFDSNLPAWGDRLEAITLPELEGEHRTDVCVVGLGGSGLSCVHELLRLGQRVIGLDAGFVGGGAAGRNGGFLLAGTAEFYHDTVAQLGRDRARRIYQITLDELDRITTETPDAVSRNGSLRLAGSEEEERDCELQLQAMRADGFDVQPYEGPDGRGLLFPADGAFNPLARCRSLARRATDLGASLHENSRAISIGDGEIRTDRGRISCKHVIVAVDGRLEQLLPELAGKVRTARLQMLSTGPAPEVHIPRPVYARWGYDYWQQLPDGRVALGGCRDHFEENEWTTDNSPTSEVQSCMERVLRDRVGVTQPITHRWAASVSYSNNILPAMQQARPGVWAIGGYSGTGNVIGAIYGRMLAQFLMNGSSDLMPAFMPDGPK
jgi:glycine/D-amino acid oxidase-like deaminating enzyme